jgi:hypothetical protein
MLANKPIQFKSTSISSISSTFQIYTKIQIHKYLPLLLWF